MPVSHDDFLSEITEILNRPVGPHRSTETEVADSLYAKYLFLPKSQSFLSEAPPTSGHINFDFTTPEGRQRVRDIAHDLLLKAEQIEADEAATLSEDVARLAAIITSTSDATPEEAQTQAQAMIDNGLGFKTRPGTTDRDTPAADAPAPQPAPAKPTTNPAATTTRNTQPTAVTPIDAAPAKRATGKK